jgi:CheY-like chemotaxis protein
MVLHVLLIDDNALALRSLSRLLSGRFTVTSVASAEQAIVLVDGGARFDTILCDLDLGPGLSGRDLYNHLVGRCPEQAAHFLIFSGEPPSAGDPLADRYLLKPATVWDLVERVVAIAGPGAVVARA